MEKKISIIIPVYNTEKYISECLYSILRQSYQTFEVIIIDDGSTDNSYNICKNISKNDHRVYIYKQKNSGVSSARNYGISKCTGDYILFIDSDDYLANDALEIISKHINKNSLISFGYIKKYKDKEIKYTSNYKRIINQEDMINNILLNKCINGYLWNKLYSKQIIDNNKLTFDTKIHYSEDLLFNLKYLNYCSEITNIDIPLYYYRMRKSGVSYRYINPKNATILDSFGKLIDDYASNIKIKNGIELLYLYEYWKFKKIYESNKVRWDIINREKEIIKNNNMSKMNIIKYYIIYKNKSIYLFFKRLKNVIEKTYD